MSFASERVPFRGLVRPDAAGKKLAPAASDGIDKKRALDKMDQEFCPSIRSQGIPNVPKLWPGSRREEDVQGDGMQSRNSGSQWRSGVESKNFYSVFEGTPRGQLGISTLSCFDLQLHYPGRSSVQIPGEKLVLVPSTIPRLNFLIPLLLCQLAMAREENALSHNLRGHQCSVEQMLFFHSQKKKGFDKLACDRHWGKLHLP